MVFVKLHAVGAQPILEAVPFLHVLFQVKGKSGRLIALEKVPEDLQARRNVQFPPYGGKLGKVGDEVCAHTGEIGAGFIDIPLRHSDGDVAVLHDTAAHAGDCGKQHLVVLFPVGIQPIFFHRKQQGFLKLCLVDLPVVDGDLGGSAGVQRVE